MTKRKHRKRVKRRGDFEDRNISHDDTPEARRKLFG